MTTDKIICQICKEELQEEENCPKCCPEAPKIYENSIELATTAAITI